jgi:hypothetical protein
MNLKKTDRDFFDLVQTLKENGKLDVLTYGYPDKIDKASKQAIEKVKLPPLLVEFLQSMNGLYLKWENRNQDTTLIAGSLRILPGKEIAKEWNGVVYFDDDTSAGLKEFYPVDFFADEACCGVFAGGKNNSLHYYAFSSGEEPYNLQIDIEDYVTLAIEVKCYRYWPLLVKLITEKISSPMIQKFHDDMAVLFPDFSVEKFMNRYKELSKKI